MAEPVTRRDFLGRLGVGEACSPGRENGRLLLGRALGSRNLDNQNGGMIPLRREGRGLFRNAPAATAEHVGLTPGHFELRPFGETERFFELNRGD